MSDFILRIFQRIGLWVGLLFVGGSLAVGGMKFYQQSTYFPTHGTVEALSIKCDMSYRTGKSTSHHSVVECSDVNDVKSRYPDINWTVNRVQYIDFAYASASGKTMRAVLPLSRLERTSAKVGDRFPVLQSRNDPKFITGPANAHFMKIWATMFAIGIALLAGWRWIKIIRHREPEAQPLSRAFSVMSEPPEALAPATSAPTIVEKSSRLPVMPQPTVVATRNVVTQMRAQFGRR